MCAEKILIKMDNKTRTKVLCAGLAACYLGISNKYTSFKARREYILKWARQKIPLLTV